MKKITLALFMGGFLLSSQTNFAQTKKTTQVAKPKKAVEAPKKTVATEPNQDDMMKAWQTYMTPTDVHKMIAQSDGVWTGEVSHWMTPDAAATTSECHCTNRMVMGGRYQVSDYTGDFMGSPFEGMGTLAFDNAKKVFISTWIDNMGTGVMVLQGPWDEKTRSISLKGTMVDPMTGKDTKAEEKFTIVDDNTQVMEMFAPRPDGKGMFKTMSIKFKRG